MKAAIAREIGMSSEERLAQIESNMGHVLSTLVEFRKSTTAEIKEVRAEVHELRADLDSFKTETAKEFGFVRAEIEKLRTAIESTKVWFLVTCFGAVFSGIGAVVALHALNLL
jgi:hypothetical protein